jgi:glucose/mannose transport system permease protein
MIALEAAKRDIKSKLNVVAFLDDDPKKEGKNIDGKRIYRGIDALEDLVEDLGIQDLIISVKDLSIDRKNEILDTCLRLQVKVSKVLPVDQWINGDLNAGALQEIRIEDLLSREEIVLDNHVLAHNMQGKVILVSGAAGSIGSELCRQVAFYRPSLLILLDASESPLFDIQQEFKERYPSIAIKTIVGDVRNKKRKLNGKEKFWLIFRYVSLAFIWFLVVMPIYVMVINSLKGVKNVYLTNAFKLPEKLDFSAWSVAWNGTDYFPQAISESMTRTLFFVIQSALLSAVIGSINGYVFAKWKFKGSNLIFTLFLFGMFIPYQAIMIPLVRLATELGVNKSIYVLVFAHVIYGIPICTLIFRNYYERIPNELIEAVRVYKASMVRIYRSIILPLSVPAFVVVLIWQFTSAWNDVLFAIFLTGGSPKLSVATTALNFITGSSNQVYYGVNMTASLIVSLPTLIVYIFLGRYFLKGLLSGSLKG